MKNDFYVERYPDCKLVIALSDGLASVDLFAKDYHQYRMCLRDEVMSVKADLIYMFRRNLKS